MGDDKKKGSGGKKGGFLKFVVLVALLLAGAQLASAMLSQPTWGPMYWVQTLLLRR